MSGSFSVGGIPVRLDETLPPDVFQLVSDGKVLLTVDLGYAPPVAGEIVDGPHCPHCPHPLAEHYREKHSCMYSTPTETWACDCPGPADQP